MYVCHNLTYKIEHIRIMILLHLIPDLVWCCLHILPNTIQLYLGDAAWVLLYHIIVFADFNLQSCECLRFHLFKTLNSSLKMLISIWSSRMTLISIEKLETWIKTWLCRSFCFFIYLLNYKLKISIIAAKNNLEKLLTFLVTMILLQQITILMYSKNNASC